VRRRVDEQRDRFLGDGAVGEAELDDVSNGVSVAGMAGVEGGRGGLKFELICVEMCCGGFRAEAPFLFGAYVAAEAATHKE